LHGVNHAALSLCVQLRRIAFGMPVATLRAGEAQASRFGTEAPEDVAMMTKLVFAAVAMWAIYTLLDHYGSTLAAAWLTGGTGCLVAVWFGLARA
jgi:hypothetical protein